MHQFFSFELQREGKGVPEASLPFHRAMPSLTHMALVALEKAGFLKFVISQVWLHHFALLQIPGPKPFRGVWSMMFFGSSFCCIFIF